MTDFYSAIFADLTTRRAAVAAELNRLDAAIAALKPLVGSETTGTQTQSVPAPVSGVVVLTHTPRPEPVAADNSRPETGHYGNLSVRWAALWHFAEFADGPMRNSEVADAIRAGGYHSGAGSFPNAVSAVLSGMRAKGEIDGTPEIGYSLTEKGREIWQSIKKSDRFRSAMSHAAASANAPSLLSVQ
jgi:hypothetical protein